MSKTATATRRTTRAQSAMGDGVPVQYRRVSKFRVTRLDVDAEVVRNIDRQDRDNRAACDALGLGPVGHDFVDDDRSASQFATKERDAWVALLAYIATGAVSHVVVWLFDRAARTTEDTEALLAACRAGGAYIVQSATRDIADPHNPDDIFRLKLQGLLAEYEVGKMSVRQRRAKRQAAEDGAAHGGRRAFGYEPSRAARRESEAVVVRDLADRFLAGESLRSLALSLNHDEVPMASGKVGGWTGPRVRELLMSPYLAGLRVSGRDESGRPIVVGDAKWDPILTVETHHNLVAMLSNPERRSTGTTNARKHLLSGLAVCDTCGGRAKVSTYRRNGKTTPVYACVTGRHFHKAVAKVDPIVEGAVVGMLARHDNRGVLVDDEAANEVVRLREAREAITARIADLDDAFGAGDVPAKAYGRQMARLEREADRLDRLTHEAEAEVGKSARVLDGATGAVAAEVWADLPLSRRRAIIGELAEVRLQPAARRGNAPFNPDEVLVVWR